MSAERKWRIGIVGQPHAHVTIARAHDGRWLAWYVETQGPGDVDGLPLIVLGHGDDPQLALEDARRTAADVYRTLLLPLGPPTA